MSGICIENSCHFINKTCVLIKEKKTSQDVVFTSIDICV